MPWPFTRFPEFPEFGLLGNLGHQGADMIRVEEFLEDDRLVVRAEIPGIDPENDIEVTISHGALHIDVMREQKAEHKERDGFRTEFRYGSFSRTIPLPAGTYETEVKATYDNGILEIRLPVAKTTTRKVQVTRA